VSTFIQLYGFWNLLKKFGQLCFSLAFTDGLKNTFKKHTKGALSEKKVKKSCHWGDTFS